MIASDRLSAFDVVLPRAIPYKGQVLNGLAAHMLQATRDICPNWLRATPAPNASAGINCIPYKVEVVVRGNLCGHAWRTYVSGQRILCGVLMPDGMRENDYFSEPIVTPATKESEGHDEDISEEDILRRGIVSPSEWAVIRSYALRLFARGNELAARSGLILADTKYEFGKSGDDIVLIDEIHTPDSSRYFYSEGFADRQQRGEKQKQLSKEFVREWLIENEFMGKEGQTVPLMTDEWVNVISGRYIELYEVLTGKIFEREALSNEETYDRITAYLSDAFPEG
jgi:phosphoribosylaminoimidazole-succinocarboxamide synthase